MAEIPIIDQSISTVAPVLHRDTINQTIPATQDAFVQSVEAFFDKISDTTVNEINQVTTKIDTTVAAINITAQEISEVATIAIASGKYKGDWVAGFETIGYSLGDGVTFTDGYNYVSKINNNLTTPITLTNTDQWNFIEAVNPNNYYLKTETYTKTEVDTLHEINNKTDKTTPVDTDNFLMEEIEGLFKKLNWANLKATLKTYFDTLYTVVASSETVSGIIELATTAEAQAGTDDLRAITPLKLRNALNASGTAPIYACRAWVNFNGTGTVAIRASGNVSSITDNGVGNYTVKFTTAMLDANYTVTTSSRQEGDANENSYAMRVGRGGEFSTTGVKVVHGYYTTVNVYTDCNYGLVSIFI